MNLLRTVKIRLRPANDQDAPLLFDWGNAEDVRKGRLNGSAPLEWMSHCQWLQARIDRVVSEQIFMAVYGKDSAVGVGRISPSSENNNSVISITVAPEARRCGIGHKIIKLLVGKIQKEGRTPIAYVLNTNRSSQRLFAGSGFTFTGGSLGFREYRLEA